MEKFFGKVETKQEILERWQREVHAEIGCDLCGGDGIVDNHQFDGDINGFVFSGSRQCPLIKKSAEEYDSLEMSNF